MKNLRIYEEWLYGGRNTTGRHWGFFVALLLGVAAFVASAIYGVITLPRTI